MLHFAYGSNMDRDAMRQRCPTASAVGMARLDGWHFIITRDGYASVVPALGRVVYGVLWRLGPRDLVALNAYEALDRGLYRRRAMPVTHATGRVRALIYVARERREGTPRSGYQENVIAAARDWRLPADYVRLLERWLPSGRSGARATETGAIA